MAVIVLPDIRQQRSTEVESRLEEARGLALAIGIDVRDAVAVPIRSVKAGTLFGTGQIENLGILARQHEAELIIVDGTLSAIQQRNLEERLKTKVIDRTGLILEIFGERAVTAEGRLQVELAHLDYQAGRLVRSWTHLERQRGGFGFLGGPGETQIEADRRMIRERTGKLRRDLEQVRRTRGLHRDRRQRAPWPIITLVGYTNTGKSTLFNALTGASVMAEDLLFATLDPTMRNIKLPGIDKAILSDTVGFISDLPTQLIAAFRATLEEVTAANLILHVRDVANPDSAMQAREVMVILADLGVGSADGLDNIPVLEVWNKADLVTPEELEAMQARAPEEQQRIVVSAAMGQGLDNLRRKISEIFSAAAREYRLFIPLGDGKQRAWLRAHGEQVASQAAIVENIEGDWITVRLTEIAWGRFCSLFAHEMTLG